MRWIDFRSDIVGGTHIYYVQKNIIALSLSMLYVFYPVPIDDYTDIMQNSFSLSSVSELPQTIELSSETLIRILVVLGIGILIGLEREYTYRDQGEIFAGVRTFPLIVLWGFLAAFLSPIFSSSIFIASLLGLLLLIGISYVLRGRNGSPGGTSEIAAILAFMLGGLVETGYVALAVGLAVVLTTALSLKIQLHTFVGKFTAKDIRALLQFIVISFLCIPFLPATPIGPYPFLIPREIWLIVVLVTSINFAGYLLTKFISPHRSILTTGILGSLVSSTAVTVNFSRKSKEMPEFSHDYAAGIILASSMMFPRVLVLTFITNQELFSRLLVPLLLCAISGATVGLVLTFSKKQKETQEEHSVETTNPLDLLGALKFGGIYVSILFLLYFVQQYASTGTLYAAGALSGITDVDAITISMGKLANSSSLWQSAQNTIIIATLSNTIVKYGICLGWGSRPLRQFVSLGFLAIATVGGIVLVMRL